ncbi:MAG TPA: lysophospholipid acyltransferase family protein [Thermoanaerobaculia bacterium]
MPRSVRKHLAEKKVRPERASSRVPGLLRSRWVAAPLSALLWVSCVVTVIAWTPLILLFRLLTFPWDRDRYRVGRLFHDSAAFVARINPFWNFRIRDEVHPDDRRPYVFVANHSSFTDVFLLASLPWEMKFLSKKSIFRIPLLGWQMRIAGDVPIVRGDRESVRAAMEELRRRLDRRLSVVFFPEGTRSPDGSLGEFREGAFRLAIEAGVPVLPLAIYGASSSLPKHSVVFQPTAATVVVLPPESTEGLTAADAPRLAARVRDRIAEAIRKVEISETPASR